jgi:hypothetical protein
MATALLRGCKASRPSLIHIQDLQAQHVARMHPAAAQGPLLLANETSWCGAEGSAAQLQRFSFMFPIGQTMLQHDGCRQVTSEQHSAGYLLLETVQDASV